ncbi:MAG: hypothetical protein QOE90_917 [Thermoplasmata archaeon]|jgi:hypothetical protein|nr:hypothetical protein [Thermoplasmata archaeon]
MRALPLVLVALFLAFAVAPVRALPSGDTPLPPCAPGIGPSGGPMAPGSVTVPFCMWFDAKAGVWVPLCVGIDPNTIPPGIEYDIC